MFTCPDQSSVEDVLDYVKVSDLVAFAWPLDGEVSAEQELVMSCLLSHGLPTTMHFAPGLAALSTPKSKENARKNVQKLIDRWSVGHFVSFMLFLQFCFHLCKKPNSCPLLV